MCANRSSAQRADLPKNLKKFSQRGSLHACNVQGRKELKHLIERLYTVVFIVQSVHIYSYLSRVMKNKNLLMTIIVAAALLQINSLALAATPFPPQPLDLPPGTVSYGNANQGNLSTDPNVIAAIIGVTGLLVGSAVTIFATMLMRWMDIRRENKREDLLIERSKKEKGFQIKQELYKNFLNELAHLESFQYKDLDTFKKEWTKTEVKVDLVASENVRNAKEIVQEELMNIAEKNLKAGSATLSPNYLKNRDALLKAIREDIDIF